MNVKAKYSTCITELARAPEFGCGMIHPSKNRPKKGADFGPVCNLKPDWEIPRVWRPGAWRCRAGCLASVDSSSCFHSSDVAPKKTALQVNYFVDIQALNIINLQKYLQGIGVSI